MRTRGPQAAPRRLLTDWTTTAGVAGRGLAALVAGPDSVPEAVHLATLGYEVFVLDGATPDDATPSTVHVVDVTPAAVPDAWHGRFALVLTDVASAPDVVACVADAGLLVVLGDAADRAALDLAALDRVGLTDVVVEAGPDPDEPAVERFRAVHARL